MADEEAPVPQAPVIMFGAPGAEQDADELVQGLVDEVKTCNLKIFISSFNLIKINYKFTPNLNERYEKTYEKITAQKYRTQLVGSMNYLVQVMVQFK